MQSTKPKEDLRYYDELIEKMKDMENDENPESKEEIGKSFTKKPNFWMC